MQQVARTSSRRQTVEQGVRVNDADPARAGRTAGPGVPVSFVAGSFVAGLFVAGSFVAVSHAVLAEPLIRGSLFSVVPSSCLLR